MKTKTRKKHEAKVNRNKQKAHLVLHPFPGWNMLHLPPSHTLALLSRIRMTSYIKFIECVCILLQKFCTYVPECAWCTVVVPEDAIYTPVFSRVINTDNIDAKKTNVPHPRCIPDVSALYNE